jgi:hypothetical protein
MYALIEVHLDNDLEQVSKPLGIDGGFSLASLEMACIFNCVHSAMAKYEGTGLFLVPLTRLTLSGLNICG